jgi:hypothetical protein
MVHYLCEGNDCVYVYKFPLIPLCRGLVFSSISPCIMVLYSRYLKVLFYFVFITYNHNFYMCVF